MPVNITEEFVRNLITQIETLTAQNQALTATVAELNQTIKELKEDGMVGWHHRLSGHEFE